MDEPKFQVSDEAPRSLPYRKPPRLKDKPERFISGFVLPPQVRIWLARACKDTGLNRSEYVARALKKQIKEDYGKEL